MTSRDRKNCFCGIPHAGVTFKNVCGTGAAGIIPQSPAFPQNSAFLICGIPRGIAGFLKFWKIRGNDSIKSYVEMTQSIKSWLSDNVIKSSVKWSIKRVTTKNVCGTGSRGIFSKKLTEGGGSKYLYIPVNPQILFNIKNDIDIQNCAEAIFFCRGNLCRGNPVFAKVFQSVPKCSSVPNGRIDGFCTVARTGVGRTSKSIYIALMRSDRKKIRKPDSAFY